MPLKPGKKEIEIRKLLYRLIALEIYLFDNLVEKKRNRTTKIANEKVSIQQTENYPRLCNYERVNQILLSFPKVPKNI